MWFRVVTGSSLSLSLHAYFYSKAVNLWLYNTFASQRVAVLPCQIADHVSAIMNHFWAPKCVKNLGYTSNSCSLLNSSNIIYNHLCISFHSKLKKVLGGSIRAVFFEQGGWKRVTLNCSQGNECQVTWFHF